MLEFHPLKLEDFPALRPYFVTDPGRICDSTPGSTFIWRDMYNVQYAIADGQLYFKVDYPGLGETFTLPLGHDRQAHYCKIAEYCCKRSIPIAFYPVPAEELEGLQNYFPNSAAVSDRDTFDYLYTADTLKYFKGKKLAGQRNHVNKFLKTYGNWEFKVMEDGDIPAVKEFLDRYAAKVDKDAESFHEDIRKTHEVLDNFRTYGLVGGMLFAEGQMVGFSLGEVVGDTLFTHIEKADREIQGGYQMLVSQFAQQFAVDGVDFINREDDTGDPGLRKSKLSYHPVALLEKFTVTIETPCAAQKELECGCHAE